MTYRTNSSNFYFFMENKFGSIELLSNNKIYAGKFTTIKLVYTAGYYGIDDTGSIKISYRFASDLGKPQFEDKYKKNYTSIKCSNSNIKLSYHFDMKMNIRPWDRTIYIKLIKGFLKEGEKIYLIFGDKKNLSGGIRGQTFCEKKFRFKLSVDPFATCKYIDLPFHKAINILPTEPYKIKIIAPTSIKTKNHFTINLIVEDKWGNPTYFKKNKNINLVILNDLINLKKKIIFKNHLKKLIIQHSFEQQGNYTVSILGLGKIKIEPMLIVVRKQIEENYFWGDIHGQSEETIGTNSIEDYFSYAKNISCLDVSCHQGNDFQINDEFWNKIIKITNKYHQERKFVCFLGYEWSGNTSLGGDRNVIYNTKKGPIYRSSFSLLKKNQSIFKSASNVNQLHKLLDKKKAITIPHVGGRYSDINNFFNPEFEKSIEIHSAWGTFEWLLFDAFKKKYKVGILANSDDHKGRPGASYPGASMFGSYGGLSCFIAKSLTKKNIFNCLRQRRHYATTGNRVFINLKLIDEINKYKFYDENKKKFIKANQPIMMGDICCTKNKQSQVSYEILSSDQIEKIQLLNFDKIIYEKNFLKKGMVLRVIWQGAEYRGRGREADWHGKVFLSKNNFSNLITINSFNHEKQIRLMNSKTIIWHSTTTGGQSGYEVLLDNLNGNLNFEINDKKISINLKTLKEKRIVKHFGGINKQVCFSLVSKDDSDKEYVLNKKIKLNKNNGIFFKTFFRYGHIAWTSPIYIDIK